MPAVLVHGVPETAEIWNELRARLPASVALRLPGFGSPRPAGFEASARVAATVGAATVPLPGLRHCWMAEAPQAAADALLSFWSAG